MELKKNSYDGYRAFREAGWGLVLESVGTFSVVYLEK